eukprot:4703811-Amphidinium_carterae.1
MVSRQLILGFVSQEGSALSDVPTTFKADREIVTAAVSDDGYALRYAAEELRGDRDIVVAAVRQNGHALQFASLVMRSTAEVVIAAVLQTWLALEYSVPELLLDEEIKRNSKMNMFSALQSAGRCSNKLTFRAEENRFAFQSIFRSFLPSCPVWKMCSSSRSPCYQGVRASSCLRLTIRRTYRKKPFTKGLKFSRWNGSYRHPCQQLLAACQQTCP